MNLDYDFNLDYKPYQSSTLLYLKYFKIYYENMMVLIFSEMNAGLNTP